MVNQPDRNEQDNEFAAPFRLRSNGPPVMRLSRKVLSGLVIIGAAVVLGGLTVSLYQGNATSGVGTDLYSIANKPPPDGLANLPRDYAVATNKQSVELPRPIPVVPSEVSQLAPESEKADVDPDQQRLDQESQAARTSQLFATTAGSSQPAGNDPSVSVPDQKTASKDKPDAPPPLDPGSLQNMQDRKLAFANGAVDHRTVSLERLQNPASRYLIQAGTVIPAALITGIRSDLPGQVTAQVTENVYDSLTGRHLLIPQGSKLIGVYDSQVAYAQDRLLMVWTRLIMTNGRSIVLERQPGADTQGFNGLEDEVDNHWRQLFMGAIVSTVIGIGSEIGTNANTSSITSALQQGSGNALNQVGSTITQRNLNIQPTITIRPGFPLRVIIDRDLVLAPNQS